MIEVTPVSPTNVWAIKLKRENNQMMVTNVNIYFTLANMESIQLNAKIIAANLLPEKSKEKYIQVLNNFFKWKEEKEIEKSDFSEAVLLVYFDFLKSE